MNARRFAAVLMFALACAAPLRTASAQNELGPTPGEIVKRERLNGVVVEQTVLAQFREATAFYL